MATAWFSPATLEASLYARSCVGPDTGVQTRLRRSGLRIIVRAALAAAQFLVKSSEFAFGLRSALNGATFSRVPSEYTMDANDSRPMSMPQASCLGFGAGFGSVLTTKLAS